MAEAIADLVIRIGTDVELLKRDMNEASRTVKRTADDISGSLGFIKGAFGALTSGLTLGALWGTFRAGVSELAALDDAAENAGTSVEKLGQVVADLAPSGASVSQISGMVQQLNRSLLTAENHTSRAGSAFKALGIDVKDSAGNFKDGTDLLREIAVALDQYEDGTNKSQLATALLGRAGAQNIAMLKELARANGETNKYTSEMAAAAETLDKNMNRLTFQINQTKVALLSNLIPALNQSFEALNRATNAGLTLKETLRTLLQPQRYVMELEAELMSAVTANQNMLKSGNVPPQVLENQRKLIEDLETRLGKVKRIKEAYEPTLADMLDQQGLPDPYGAPDKTQAPRIPDIGAQTAAAREAMQVAMADLANERKRAVEQYKEHLATLKYETDIGLKSDEEALRERQQLEGEHLSRMIGYYNQEILIKERADGKLRDQSAIVQAKNERQGVIDQLLDIETRYARELELSWKKSSEAIAKASAAARNAETQSLNSLQQANKALADGNEARIQSIVTGRELAEVEREVAIARLESELALDERPDPNKVRRLELLREELKLYRQRNAIEAQAARQAAERNANDKVGVDAFKKFEDDARKAAETIHDSLTNAILRGFEDGKGIAENFRDTLKNMFMTMILRPVIEPIMKPVADIAGNIVSAIVQAATGGVVGTVFGTGKAAPIEARAEGGPVIPGGTYLVGEEGPELLRMGGRGGYITPNSAGRATIQINQTFHIGSGVDAATAQSIWMASKEAAKAEIADAAARSGRGIY